MSAKQNKTEKGEQPAAKRPRAPRSPVAKTTVVIAGVITVVFAGYLISGLFTDGTGEAIGSENTANAPKYRTVLPDGKSAEELDGWQRVSPPGSAPVFAYEDSIGGVAISVSQQPMPDSLSGGQVAELAKKFNATNELKAGGTTAYLGTSAKGPQSVIFAKADLLILIKSEENIGDKQWIAYINSLNNIYTRNVPKF